MIYTLQIYMAGLQAALSTSSGKESDFEAFYKEWLVDQQRLLDRLICLSIETNDASRHETEEERLIEEVLSHYKRYYDEKAKAIASLSFFFYLTWIRLTDLEKELFWFGGFRPSMALSLMEATVVDLSSEQKQRVVAIREEVVAEERVLEMKEEEEEMTEVVRMADGVRRETVVKAVESLSGRQTVKFLVAIGSYHLGMRCLGINFPL